MSGYLKVWKSRKWKKLWFVLKGKALYTFKASEVSRVWVLGSLRSTQHILCIVGTCRLCCFFVFFKPAD